MLFSRRQYLLGMAGAWCAAGTFARTGSLSAKAEQAGTRIVLLGTKGGPPLSRSGRSNSSTALVINETAYIVDCGYGVSRQLVSSGIGLGRVGYVFITHLHSDHTLEYGTLLYNTWLTPMPPKVVVYGPAGLVDMTRAFMESQKFDIETRIEDEGMSDLRNNVTVHEQQGPGLVMQNADVRVTCCRVPHPPIVDSYAFRFDSADRSVVISGDTAFSPDLIELAKDADVLIHEALYLPGVDAIVKRATNATRLREHILASHTSTEDVGRVAAAANVKTLVLNHLIPGDDPSIMAEQWIAGVRKYYAGPVIVGHDLMEF
jgi:ribonuclease BN (tRNA processing enzyme)